MDFKQTGLPLEPSVYKAFMLYKQNVKEMPKRYQEDYPVRVAKVLFENIGEDYTLITASLLMVMPPPTYGIIEQRFGKDVIDLLTEANKQAKTGHEHLVHASERAKLLCMASVITSFDDFKNISAKMDRQLAQQQEQGSIDEPMVILRIPDTTVYDKITDAVIGKTSNTTLEDLYTEKLADFKIFNIEHNEKLDALGFGAPASGASPSSGLPSRTELRFPAFEDTSLIDDPVVREAYAIITTHKRVLPENFEGAIEVGRMLSLSVADPSPATVAAALIGVAVMDMMQAELDVFKERLDADVIKILMAGSIYDTTMGPDRIMKAPVEFRQIVLANAVAIVENMLLAGDEIISFYEESKDTLPEGFLVQNLMPIGMTYMNIKAQVMPTFGTTDLPELEARLDESMKNLFEFMDKNVPRPREDKTAAPKPPNGGPRL